LEEETRRENGVKILLYKTDLRDDVWIKVAQDLIQRALLIFFIQLLIPERQLVTTYCILLPYDNYTFGISAFT
jgi:hypothetical protein